MPVSSIKALTGHTLGAAGAIEAVASVLAMRRGVIPPTWNWTEADPECDIDCVPNEPRPAVLRHVLSNSYAFGGNNSSLVLSAPTPMSGPLVVTGVGLVSAAGDTAESVLARHARGHPARLGGDRRVRRHPLHPAKGRPRPLPHLAARLLGGGRQRARPVGRRACGRSASCSARRGARSTTVIEFEREAHLQGARFVDPILFTETVSNVPAGQVAILYGWSAFNATLSSGTASGLAALRQAVQFLAEDRGSVAVAGGGDEINPRLLSALEMRGWSGPAGGEGACFLTIEGAEHARSRGASALGSIRATAERFGDSPPA